MHGQTAYCLGLRLRTSVWEGLLALAFVYSVSKVLRRMGAFLSFRCFYGPGLNIACFCYICFSQKIPIHVTAWEGPLRTFNLNRLWGIQMAPINKGGLSANVFWLWTLQCRLSLVRKPGLCVHIFSYFSVPVGQRVPGRLSSMDWLSELTPCQQPLCVRPIKFVCTWQQ